MKKILRLLLVLSVGVVLPAFAAATDSEVPNRTPEEIEKLVSPIALYPDSLVALILPAATESADVVLAARFLDFDGKESDIEKQFWHESVKSLAHYPDLVRWMDENLEWTQQLGEVFAAQPADVMAAIQRLRAHARANGLLADTPQQRVVVERETVYIVPADPACIYVPRYDPEILWTRRSHRGSFISFSVGFSVGNWLFYDCDWPGRTIWVHRRHPGWVYNPFWRPPPPAARVHVVTAWCPPPHHHRRVVLHGHRPPPRTIVVAPPCGPADIRRGPGFRDGHRSHGPSRHLPPGHVVAPSHPHPRPPSPPPTAGPRPNHRDGNNRLVAPVPPAHEGPRPRVHSEPPRHPGPGSATATLRRPVQPAPHQPTVSSPPPEPSRPPRPMGPSPSTGNSHRPGGGHRIAPPPPPPPANPPPAPAPSSNENRDNRGGGRGKSGGDNDGEGRRGHRGR